MNRALGQQVDVFSVPCSGPGDLSGLHTLVDAGRIDPRHVVAVMGKTEGNGCVNDYTREYASSAWCQWLASCLECTPAEVAQRVALVMSGGTEGVLSPHFTVFTRRWISAAPGNGMLRESFDFDTDSDTGPDGQVIAARLVNLLAKAEASPDGLVRNARHTMLNDSDINATRHARAAVGGALAALAGHTALYVSGGAEHQGPPGGGPVAAIVRA